MVTPNPGSREARQLGCTCPVLENNNGTYPPCREAWWVHTDCSVHGYANTVECPSCEGVGEVRHPRWGSRNCPTDGVECQRCHGEGVIPAPAEVA